MTQTLDQQENLVNYVAALSLKDTAHVEVDNPLTALFRDNLIIGQRGYVVAGALACAQGAVAEPLLSDVLNSVLLSQLTATKRYDRFSNNDARYQTFQEALSNIGWSAEGFSFDSFHSQSDPYMLNDVVEKSL